MQSNHPGLPVPASVTRAGGSSSAGAHPPHPVCAAANPGAGDLPNGQAGPLPLEDASLSGSAAIDAAVLEEIRLLERAGAPDLLRTVITLYLADAPKILALLGEAVREKNGPVIHRTAHRFKSSSGSIGARCLATLLTEAERLGRENRTEEAGEVFLRIRDAYGAVRTALEGEIAFATGHIVG